MTMPRWLSNFIGRTPPPLHKDQVDIGELHELVRFVNDTGRRIPLMIEPWAHSFWIAPSAAVVVMTDTFPIDEASEISFSDECVSMYWRGDEVLYVFENGVRVQPFLP